MHVQNHQPVQPVLGVFKKYWPTTLVFDQPFADGQAVICLTSQGHSDEQIEMGL